MTMLLVSEPFRSLVTAIWHRNNCHFALAARTPIFILAPTRK